MKIIRHIKSDKKKGFFFWYSFFLLGSGKRPRASDISRNKNPKHSHKPEILLPKRGIERERERAELVCFLFFLSHMPIILPQLLSLYLESFWSDITPPVGEHPWLKVEKHTRIYKSRTVKFIRKNLLKDPFSDQLLRVVSTPSPGYVLAVSNH